MATTYRHSGKHIPVASASGPIVSSAIVVQEGWFGIAIKSAATGESLELDVEGVHRLPVPAGVTKGTLLYVPGAPATEDNSADLTATATSNTLFGKAVSDRDADGFALVKLARQP
jgi:predicted RecA/RadA family phage recombinase